MKITNFNKKIIKFILEKTYRPFLVSYLSKERTYRYKDLTLLIRRGVFHPHFFFSTRLLLKFLADKNVTGKNVLELGAGSGLISLALAGKGGKLTSTDISKVSIENIKENAFRNHLELQIIQSDLFDELEGMTFDTIIINPPYYPRDPLQESEYAWYCGEDFTYFKKLFSQVKKHIHKESEVYMILSDDCEIKKIQALAGSENLEFINVFRKKVWWEVNYIFLIKEII